MHLAIGTLTKPLLLTLLMLHGLTRSWTLALISLVALLKVLQVVLMLITPGRAARRRYEKDLEALKKKFDHNVSPEFRLQELELQHLHALPSRQGIPELLLSLLGTLLRGYGYLGLWYVLICAPALHGAQLLWIPDMTAPDPHYILPLCVFLLFGGGVLASRRNHDLRKTYNWFLILVPPGWAGLNAFLPAGLVFYHLISFWTRPLITLVLGVPLLLSAQLARLRGDKER